MIVINVADVREFAAKAGIALPDFVEDEAIAGFTHHLKMQPDGEVHFWGRRFEDAASFEAAVKEALS